MLVREYFLDSMCAYVAKVGADSFCCRLEQRPTDAHAMVHFDGPVMVMGVAFDADMLPCQ